MDTGNPCRIIYGLRDESVNNPVFAGIKEDHLCIRTPILQQTAP